MKTHQPSPRFQQVPAARRPARQPGPQPPGRPPPGRALLNGLLGGGLEWAGIAASLIFVSSFICETVFSIVGKPLIERAGLMKILTLALLFGTLANLLLDGPQTFAAARAMPARGWWLVLLPPGDLHGGGLRRLVRGHSRERCQCDGTDLFVSRWRAWRLPEPGLHEPCARTVLGCLAIVAGMALGLSRQIKTVP